ncbi:putative Phosphatidylinositol 3-and 4-kinase [Taphrina deformans PYCC 5710]|uniref:Serine/threonine-protein kinase TEL1 n=1 Tax=Taphrina deformans (strain PYCC 5710 / ATCC 11124 / CBS 356.35 / IMI 108563 / JCM 9778 / NBRC 8474) TaxID=1097556 RepID=R4X816_TAPDE|nr:putative Phosphatidylinositol 3-and 4-kinase [Taphrina deformans PYCC 5710]|eukprot:CCG81639.1 putative Phosphatidylinositol 3-and 4-kinase [Taphrina deformans PYCC 5710]
MYDAALFLEYHVMQCRTASSSPAIQAVQESIYLTLTEPDSYYGVIVVPSLQAALQRVRYEHGSGKSLPFHAAMQAAERRLSRNKDPDLQQLIDASYCDLGYDSLSLIGGNFVQSTNDAKFESAWRLEEWNLPFTSSPQIQQIMYQTLCKLSTVDWAQSSQTDRILDNAHMHFSVCLDRRSTQTKLILGSFVELSEIVNIRSDHLQEILKLLKTTWRARSTSLKKILEPDAYEFFIAARQVYSNMARKQIKDDSPLITAQLELLISDYECCSKSQSQQALLNATTFAERLATSPGYSCPFALRVQLDSLVADVLWQYGESSMSISLLSNVIERTKKSHDVAALILSTNLLNIGLRSAHGRLEKPKEILHKYLLSSIEHLCHESSEAAGNIHARFASFCHEQFMSHDQNKDFQRLERLRNEKKQEIMILDSLKDSCNGSEEKRRLLAQRDKARSVFEVDDAEYQQIKSTRSVYLRSSLTSFLKAFTLTESADMLISRCCALWFANSADSIANESFSEVVTKVPSHKFLILLNQFLSRISTTNDMFQTNLTTLLLRLAKDHPYHSLYTMYAVQYSKRSGDQPAKDRARAVARVMQELMTDVSFETIATKIQCICSNYVKLATTIINKKDFPTRDIPFKSVTNYRAFSVQIPSLNLPPLTLTIEPRASCDYSDITKISSYEKTFNIAGGISAPKVLKLRLSDGSICKELVKGGNDDLRQDVVMQQVFVQVDELFKRNRETSKRKLKIRTYKVLPLATNAGVLEWVLDTKPLQDVLQPVHEKYNVDDWSYSDCRRTIAEVSKKSRQTRIEAYRRVKQHCRPAMRHAFLEMFTDAFNWYHAQLAYTRSTAAISIVGHILGLGDRHLHNILLDTKTGEVVHIDLGIAFEQGKTLPIPERVPFRLTRDIVHGMGILGVEGVFRRCCEFTLEMMRTEQAGITSILDVLKHDPLYSWTLSPVRKHRVQERANDGSGVVGSESKVPKLGGEAERALLVVEQKLSSSLSASAAVNELIQEATDEENLALVFAGWSAWY